LLSIDGSGSGTVISIKLKVLVWNVGNIIYLKGGIIVTTIHVGLTLFYASMELTKICLVFILPQKQYEIGDWR
jgi:hypothetical protein